MASIYQSEGLTGLACLPGIGASLAKKIGEMLRRGESRALEQLRRKHAREDMLVTLPTVGKLLAARIRAALGADSLEEVLNAAEDGRLQQVEGLGRKRVQAIRDSLRLRLGTHRKRRRIVRRSAFSAALLLEIDREYREQAAAQRLPKVAPLRFNPTGAAWLPVLRTERHGFRFTAHFVNTANSHQFGHAHDWVVIRSDTKGIFGLWTIVTAAAGECRGKRVVKGLERECQNFYRVAKNTQLWLPVN